MGEDGEEGIRSKAVTPNRRAPRLNGAAAADMPMLSKPISP